MIRQRSPEWPQDVVARRVHRVAGDLLAKLFELVDKATDVRVGRVAADQFTRHRARHMAGAGRGRGRKSATARPALPAGCRGRACPGLAFRVSPGFAAMPVPSRALDGRRRGVAAARRVRADIGRARPYDRRRCTLARPRPSRGAFPRGHLVSGQIIRAGLGSLSTSPFRYMPNSHAVNARDRHDRDPGPRAHGKSRVRPAVRSMGSEVPRSLRV